MTNRDITVRITQLAYDELAPADADLVEQARQATFRSYSPYSRFRVGAAILLSNGEVQAVFKAVEPSAEKK